MVAAWCGCLAGPDRWTFLLSLMIVVPPFVGWPGRRYWAICWFWIGGLILLSVYLPCLAIAAAVPLGWGRIGVPDEMVLAYYALALVLYAHRRVGGPSAC